MITTFKFEKPPLANSKGYRGGCGKDIVHIHLGEKKKEKKQDATERTLRRRGCGTDVNQLQLKL